MEGWRRRWAARAGLAGWLLLWIASIGALLAAIKANEAAGLLGRVHGSLRAGGRIEHLHGVAVMWVMVLTVLQISSLLVGAGVLRGFYRLRVAVCFAVSVGTLVLGNGLWLFGLLVWMRVYGDTR